MSDIRLREPGAMRTAAATLRLVGRVGCCVALAALASCATDVDSARFCTGGAMAYQPRAEAEAALVASINASAVGRGDLDQPLKVLQVRLPEFPHELRGDPNDRRYDPRSLRVRVLVWIERDGTVADADMIESPSSALTAAARESVRGWRFEPPMRDGKPVRYSAPHDIHFVPWTSKAACTPPARRPASDVRA